MLSAADFSAVFPPRSRQKQIAHHDDRSPEASSNCLPRWEDDGGTPALTPKGRRPLKTSSEGAKAG